MPKYLPFALGAVFVGVLFAITHADPTTAPAPVSGDAVIRAKVGGSEIVITTTSRLAGAVHSLTWKGKEFIDSVDHGRQLQSAWNADAGIDPIEIETFNPTEAGSRADALGPKTTSVLLKLEAKGNTLDSETRPAFWLAPGERSGANLARNKTLLSNHSLVRHVVIGYKDLPNVVDYNVAVTIPADEHHRVCAVEALTGYMPPDFGKFWTVNPRTSELEPVDDGPGEQDRPLVFSTADGAYAMGAFSPVVEERADQTGPTYGRFRFEPDHVVKWNCVYRLNNKKGLGGTYRYRVLVAVGTRDQVKETMARLISMFKK